MEYGCGHNGSGGCGAGRRGWRYARGFRALGDGSATGVGGSVPGVRGAVTPDAAGAVVEGGPGAGVARLVWAELTAAVDPLSVTAIGLSATVAPQLSRQALEAFEQAGLAARVAGGRGGTGEL